MNAKANYPDIMAAMIELSVTIPHDNKAGELKFRSRVLLAKMEARHATTKLGDLLRLKMNHAVADYGEPEIEDICTAIRACISDPKETEK